MPVSYRRIGGQFRIVEADNGAIARNPSGKPKDGGGHGQNRRKALRQMRAINAGLRKAGKIALALACMLASAHAEQIEPSAGATYSIVGKAAGSSANGLVIKNAPGNLYGVYAWCSAACWLMVFNSVTVPSNGSTTAGPSSGATAAGNMVECVDVPAGGSRSIAYLAGPPEFFDTGISAAISSSSCATLTLSGVGFIHGFAK